MNRDQTFTLVNKLESKKPLIKQYVLLWSDSHPPRYSWRQQESNIYQALIGEMLLDNSRYNRFLKVFPSFKDLLGASEEKLNKTMYELHLGKKMDAFSRLFKGLILEGQFPRDHGTLIRISGLKPDEVDAVFCFGCSVPLAIVNKHVCRMVTRIFENDLPSRPTIGLIKAICQSLVYHNESRKHNGAMMEIGELLCRPAMPLCPDCPVKSQCDRYILNKNNNAFQTKISKYKNPSISSITPGNRVNRRLSGQFC